MCANSLSFIQVCKIVEGQRYSKRLNKDQITALLNVTCQRPQGREHDIMQVCIKEDSVFHCFIFFISQVMENSQHMLHG